MLVALPVPNLAQIYAPHQEDLRGNAKREIAAQAVVVGHKWPSVSTTCKMVHTHH